MPAVSVIIPTYNSARFLVEAVESVLEQTWRDFEILVIDDGSTDETAAVMKQFGAPVRYIQQQNGGVAVARNKGISDSTGRYIAFLDADDTWLPEKLEKQLALLRKNQDARACYSAYSSVTSDLKPIGICRSIRHGRAIEDLLERGNIIGSICTVLCERGLFDLAGGFDPVLSQCADWDMWVRMALHTEFVYIDEPLVTYRQHGSNMSRNAPLLERDSIAVLEKGFSVADLPQGIRQRRRAAFARNYTVLAGTYFHAGMVMDSLRCAARAVSLDARQAGYLLAFPFRIASRGRLSHRAA